MTADLEKLVKPLVWMPGDCADRITAGNYDIWHENHGYQLCFWSIVQGEPHATLAAAQAAAEADHAASVLAALDTDLLAELVVALSEIREAESYIKHESFSGSSGHVSITHYTETGEIARAVLARLGVQP